MACCGQGRAALVRNETRRQTISPGLAVKIEFTQSASVFIRGPATGRHYQFHPDAQTQNVDARDAPTLIKSGYFRLV